MFFSLIIHLTSNYDWIKLLDNRLGDLSNRVVVTRAEMTTAIRITKYLNYGSIQFLTINVFFLFITQTFFVHFDRLPVSLILPTFFNYHFAAVVYTYYHWCLLGQYYLIMSYCIRLVKAAANNLILIVEDDYNNLAYLEQALADFEVIASCVYLAWKYLSKIYLIYLVATSCMIPVYLFDIIFADITIFMKLVLISSALYFLSIVGFISHLPGQIDMQLELVADRFYRKIITKKKNQLFHNLRYKFMKFEQHVLNGFGLSIGFGLRINLSTIITSATVYITVFSFLIHLRQSVNQIKFVE